MKKQHGGSRPGAGRPKDTKTSTKVKKFGLWWELDEIEDVLAACKQESVKGSSFVVSASVQVARALLNKPEA